MIKQEEVNDYWEKEVCGTRKDNNSIYNKNIHYYIKKNRYKYEGFIKEFLLDETLKDKNFLEIGVGAGTDFVEALKKGANCFGIDATDAAILETKDNISYSMNNEKYNLEFLEKHDAEYLPFEDNKFDIVYSWGVLHHAKNTMKCISEAARVLKPGGILKIMVYSDFSSTGLMLWILHGFLKFKFFLSQEEIVFKYLESPGTKCYSNKEFKKILEGFSFEVKTIKKYAGSGDLLSMPPSKKYKDNNLFKIARILIPRFLIKKFQNHFGIFLTAKAIKKI